MLVTDLEVAKGADSLILRVGAAVEGGVDWVQVRDRQATGQSLAVLAQRVVKAVGGQAKVMVNGSLDAACESGADGVHLPEGAEMVREPGMTVGRSVHSLAAASLAEAEGVDYIVAGPVFATASHLDAQPLGLGLIADISNRVSVPVLGIGGINSSRAGSVIAAGASGVAVIKAILESSDPETAARRLREAMDGARPS